MKQKMIPRLLVILVFLSITIFLSKNNAKVDGWDIYGFPFTFYKSTGGKLADKSQYAKLGFYFNYFILDLLILLFSIFIIDYATLKLKLIKARE